MLDGEQFTRRVLEGVEAIGVSSSVLGTVQPMLRVAGADLSLARTAGILGHAFTFSMRHGSGECYWEDNIDCWLFFAKLKNLGFAFDRFQATQNSPYHEALSKADLKQTKDNAWDCVRASIDRGVPAMAWSPLTVRQKADGVGSQDWGLLVGYDEAERTYTVRHPYRDNVDYDVPFDGFGYTEPVHWYSVIVPREPAPADPVAVARESLRDGVAFARGTRFSQEECCYPTAAEGLCAYELWRREIERGQASWRHAPGHASLLANLRTYAADFAEELAAEMGSPCREPLTTAAEHYRAEVAAARELKALCSDAGHDGFGPAPIREAASLIDEALAQDRLAVEKIESAADLMNV